jgi:hypothetical protein
MCSQAHDLLSGVLDKAHKLLSADLDILTDTRFNIRHSYNMRLFIKAAELLYIYTSDKILKNYNRQTEKIGRGL